MDVDVCEKTAYWRFDFSNVAVKVLPTLIVSIPAHYDSDSQKTMGKPKGRARGFCPAASGLPCLFHEASRWLQTSSPSPKGRRRIREKERVIWVVFKCCSRLYLSVHLLLLVDLLTVVAVRFATSFGLNAWKTRTGGAFASRRPMRETWLWTQSRWLLYGGQPNTTQGQRGDIHTQWGWISMPCDDLLTSILQREIATWRASWAVWSN